MLDILGAEGCDRLRALAELQNDGWGTARCETPGAPLSVRRSTLSAQDDIGFGRDLRERPAAAELLHLRWATSGLPTALENTHPFTGGGLAFIHNGSITPLAPLSHRLSYPALHSLTGNTDSEKYFALIRQHYLQGGTLAQAAAATVDEIRSFAPRASLNAMILSSRELVIVDAHAGAALSGDEMDELADHGVPGARVPGAYYRMFAKRLKDGTIAVASAFVGDDSWEPLADETIYTVALDDPAAAVTATPIEASESSSDLVATAA